MASEKINAPLPFLRFVSVAFKYFQKDPGTVPKETLELWGTEIENLPGEFYSWAIEHVKSLDSGRAVLTNPVKVIRELWQQWMVANPKKIECKEVFCQNPFCEDGWFYVYEREGETGMLLQRVGPCGECKKLGRQMRNGITRAGAEHRGYLLPTESILAEYKDQIKSAKVAYDPAKWKRHYGGRGMTGEGYERLQEAMNRETDEIPF